ncbi:MAG: DUF1254 domain-containing protein [Solirubrobacterales bacterium]|nr:DUF1254 domain-containing protein [Solirubrobacterales bacterium]
MNILSGDLRTLSYEAFVYLYPLVTMEVARRQAIDLPADAFPGCGPSNEFHHQREFPPADSGADVRANFDALYCHAWLDLTAGPVIVAMPDTHGRYYLLQMLDMWTDAFAAPGKRTTGTAAQRHLIIGPGRTGPAPDGIPVIKAPTPYVWIVGRIQTDGPYDYEFVHSLQDEMRIQRLAPTPAHEVDPDRDEISDPVEVVSTMGAREFFAYAARALAQNRPHLTDFSVLARIARLGIVPGKQWDAAGFGNDDLREIEAGAAAALEDITAAVPTIGSETNGWTTFSDIAGVYGNQYFERAVVTAAGLGANPVEDALCALLLTDGDGDPVVGEHDYVLHFDADQLPPVDAFWSLTMYDAEGFPVPNEISRVALGDRDPLTYNSDGSLGVYIQHQNPRGVRESNWLPSQPGGMGAMLRLYAPNAEVLDGRWRPPPVRKAHIIR